MSKYKDQFKKEKINSGPCLFVEQIDDVSYQFYSDWLEKRLEEAEAERERLKESCSELVQAMHDYEMLSEEEPPYKHRDMMARAKEAIENRELYADPTPGTETPDQEH